VAPGYSAALAEPTVISGARFAVSQDHRRLVALGPDNPNDPSSPIAVVWDLASPDIATRFVSLAARAQPSTVIAVSRDGHWLATGSADGTARLWDLRASDSNAPSTVLGGHGGAIESVAFSGDGHWLVTGSFDSVRLWDLTKKPSERPLVLRVDGAYQLIITTTAAGWRYEARAGQPSGISKPWTRRALRRS